MVDFKSFGQASLEPGPVFVAKAGIGTRPSNSCGDLLQTGSGGGCGHGQGRLIMDRRKDSKKRK